jgi:uncharacterized iron-regulated membrane protein
VRRIQSGLIRTVVWSTLVWAINTWGVYDRARGSGADVPSAVWHALGNVVVWPIVYVIVLPLVAFAAVMWQARRYGWNLGKQLTSGASAQPPQAGEGRSDKAGPRAPIRTR